jgi:hypothetical protein
MVNGRLISGRMLGESLALSNAWHQSGVCGGTFVRLAVSAHSRARRNPARSPDIATNRLGPRFRGDERKAGPFA